MGDSTQRLARVNCRLPTATQPLHYDLAIRTDLESDPPSFAGEILITVQVTEPTRTIAFNAGPWIQFTGMALDIGSGVSAVPLNLLVRDNASEQVLLQLASQEELAAGTRVRLWMQWKGEIGKESYHRSVGEPEANGRRPVYSHTKFEPALARWALPCWDEPAYKATWSISMIARSGLRVVSNMNAESTAPWGPSLDTSPLDPGYVVGSQLGDAHADMADLVITTFATTPLMSSYLVAFACGDFAHIESEFQSISGATVPVRVYAPPKEIDHMHFTLDVMRRAMPEYEKLFGVAYPLPKLDSLMAYDYSSLAMENWGLVMGRPACYRYDEARPTLDSQRRCAFTQSHELAHQWFGNIVTLKWWTDLWLNESFATLMGDIVMPSILWPEWNVTENFVNGNLDIDQVSNSVIYTKGAAVMRMLMTFVGRDKFLRGVSLYLQRHLYGNAETSDLWDALSETTGLEVGNLLHSWTHAVGYPVITVEEKGGGELLLTQNRFINEGNLEPHEDKTLWWIPLGIVSVTDGKTVVQQEVLSERRGVYSVNTDTDTFKLNSEACGFYRVRYSPERLVKLGKQAHHFSVADRLSLLLDATALASAGYAPVSSALGLVRALAATETETEPLLRMVRLLNNIGNTWWEADDILEAVKRFGREIYGPVLERLGYDHSPDDSAQTKKLRVDAVTNLAAYDDPEALAELQARYRSHTLPADLEAVAYRMAVRWGGAAEFEHVLDIYRSDPSQQIRVKALKALGHTQVPELLDRVFAMLLDPQAIRDIDMISALGALAHNRVARRRTCQFLADNWNTLDERFGAIAHLDKILLVTFVRLTSRAHHDHFQAELATKNVEKYTRRLAETFSGILASAQWLERDSTDVRGWFAANGYLHKN